jgi:hypothetical protein
LSCGVGVATASPVTTTPGTCTFWAAIGRRTDKTRSSVTTGISQEWIRSEYECAEERPANFDFFNIASVRLPSRNLSTQEENYNFVMIQSLGS